MNNILTYISACMEDPFFEKKFTYFRKIIYIKTFVPAFTLFFLCLLYHPSLHAQYQTTSAYKKPFYFVLKNNLLYDAALLPNLSAELYLGNKWSLAAEGNWSWWMFSKPTENEWFHRIQTVGVELRNWFCSPYPLYGHAAGVYAMTGNYDVRAFTKDENSKGWLSYRSWSAGITYAYSIPISRRVNLELGIAFGYIGGQYYEYNYCMEDEWWAQQAVHNCNYFGPTRAGISLAWLIGKGNPARRWYIDYLLGKNY